MRKKNLNLPYEELTDEKWDSLGETMTLKEACDLGWNSIRVRVRGRRDNRTRCCYLCNDGYYELDGLTKELMITLDDQYDDDADGYPIVFATEVRAPKSLI